MKHLFLLFLLIPTCLQANPSSISLDKQFKQLSNNEKRIFLNQMPKGGELHYHLAGGAYSETMLAIADDYCINLKSEKATHDANCLHTPINYLAKHPFAYQKVIKAWSMKDFISNHDESGHDHFFNSFLKFAPIVAKNQGRLLASILKRAARQKIVYLEIMIAPLNNQAIFWGKYIKPKGSVNNAYQTLISNKQFQALSQKAIGNTKKIEQVANHFLHCPNSPACDVTVRFQYYILREQPLNKMIAQATMAFLTASQAEHIVGINLVQAEDGYLSLKDYKKQMQVIAFLHKKYPKVNIALHAGELNPKAVTPVETTFHIHDAIHVAQAQRIGHGTLIAYEEKANTLLHTMAKKQIAVEINLSSNDTILNIKGKNSPLKLYLSHHVPVILSTDDEGILRTTLSREYWRAATEHHLSYQQLKQLSRNALSYSFLPGKSLWQEALKAIPVAVCSDINANKPGFRCQHYLKQNLKAKLQWRLEKQFQRFERKVKQQKKFI